MPAVPGRDPLREVVQHWHEAGVQGRAIHAVLKREQGFGGSYSASYACCASYVPSSRWR